MWVNLRAAWKACATVWLWTVGLWACPQTVTPFPKEYVGVGVELALEGDGVRVLRVIEGGPAAAAGLKAGNVITAVDGKPVKGLSLADVVAALRGPAGSTVTVVLGRADQASRVTLVRQALQRANVDGGYVSGAPAH